MIKIVGNPQGNIIKVTTKQFDALIHVNLLSFDDKLTEEKPKGQWCFNNEYDDEVERIIAKN